MRRAVLAVLCLLLLASACDRGTGTTEVPVDLQSVFTPNVLSQIAGGDFRSLTPDLGGDVRMVPPDSALAATSFFLRRYGRMMRPHWEAELGRALSVDAFAPCGTPALALPFAEGLAPTASPLARINYGPSYMARVCERGRAVASVILRVPAQYELLALRLNEDSLDLYGNVLFLAAAIPDGATTALHPVEVATFASKFANSRVREVPVLQARPFAAFAFRGDWRIVLEDPRCFRSAPGGVVTTDTVYVGLDEHGNRAVWALAADSPDSTVVLPDPDYRSPGVLLRLRLGRHARGAKMLLSGRVPNSAGGRC